MKILIMSDGQGWIVDRLTDGLIQRMTDVQFVKRFYTKIDPSEFLRLSNTVDVVHYQNSDISALKDVLQSINTPLIVSIRSFRYPEVVKELKPTLWHVIHPDLQKDFPNSVYIPDPISPQYLQPRRFIVGMACQNTPYNLEYKGVNLVKAVCDELGIELALATDVPPERMIEFYQGVDVVACASENEGHSTIVMECLAINKPVVTVDVGIPRLLKAHKVERTHESIKAMLEKFYTQPQTMQFSWESIVPQVKSMYERVKK